MQETGLFTGGKRMDYYVFASLAPRVMLRERQFIWSWEPSVQLNLSGASLFSNQNNYAADVNVYNPNYYDYREYTLGTDVNFRVAGRATAGFGVGWTRRGIVLATGGGVVIKPENRQRLHDTGWVVYLNVSPALLHERTRHDRNRPLLHVADPLAQLEALYAVRDPLYREAAHIVIDGGHLAASCVVSQLLREFNRLCKS